MKRTWLVMGIWCGLLSNWTVAGAADKAAQAVVLDETAGGKTVALAVGQLLTVRLTGDQPRSGWEGGVPDTKVLTKQGALRFEPKLGASDPAIGTYVYAYRASAAGTETLRFVYVTPGGPTPMDRDATALLKVVQVTVKVAAVAGP